VSVELRTDEPDRRFAVGTVLRLRPPRQGAAPPYPELTVRATRWHQERLLATFEELADRTAAEALRGTLLVASVVLEERPEDPDEFYDHQLVGLTVVTTDGRHVGTLAEVLHHGAQDLLVVRRDGRDDALVPFVSALVPEVDLEGGRIVVADRPGLLEPLPDEEE
jgi:16S rRNA processing protein RimM